MAESQNYANHRRWVPLYHFVLSGIAAVTLAASFVLLYRTLAAGSGRLAAGCIFLLTVMAIITGYYTRTFALRAQDRAIRAEENLRHYLLRSSPLDSRLSVRQIIGLRFAADEELAPLALRAAEEGLGEEEIKKSIRSWRGDHYRV